MFLVSHDLEVGVEARFAVQIGCAGYVSVVGGGLVARHGWK